MPAVTKIAPAPVDLLADLDYLGGPASRVAPVVPSGDDYVEVYRIQDRTDGAGPYNPKRGEYFWEMIDAHGHDPLRPGPFEGREFDDPYAIGSEHLFGFGSRADAARWFDGYLGGLHDRGYVLAVYRVRDGHVLRGKHQVVFEHERAFVAAVEDVLDLVDHLPSRAERSVVTDYDADGPDEDDLVDLANDYDVAPALASTLWPIVPVVI